MINELKIAYGQLTEFLLRELSISTGETETGDCDAGIFSVDQQVGVSDSCKGAQGVQLINNRRPKRPSAELNIEVSFSFRG